MSETTKASPRKARPLLAFRYSTNEGEGGIVHATTIARARGMAHKILLKGTDDGVLDYFSFLVERAPEGSA